MAALRLPAGFNFLPRLSQEQGDGVVEATFEETSMSYSSTQAEKASPIMRVPPATPNTISPGQNECEHALGLPGTKDLDPCQSLKANHNRYFPVTRLLIK